jgi:hypothetical protein
LGRIVYARVAGVMLLRGGALENWEEGYATKDLVWKSV